MALSLLNVLDVFVARAAAFPAFISLYAAHNVPVAMRHGTTAQRLLLPLPLPSRFITFTLPA